MGLLFILVNNNPKISYPIVEYHLLYFFLQIILPVDDTELEKLVRRAQNNDTIAFNELLHIYSPIIKSFLLRDTPAYLEIEEVVQETMISFFTSIKRFRFDSSITTYLFRIAKNTLCNLIKDHPNRKGITTFSELSCDEDIEKIAHNDVCAEFEDVIINNKISSEINEILAELSKEHRDVIVYCMIHDLTYTDTAKILKTNEGTIKSRLFRAKIELKKIIFEKIQKYGTIFSF